MTFHPGSLFLDGTHTSYRAIESLSGDIVFLSQTIEGMNGTTTILPSDAYYVFDAANPHRM